MNHELPTSLNTTRILVGVDGSDAGSSALRWAADRAAETGARLDVVHVFSEPTADVNDGEGDRNPLSLAVVTSHAQALLEACLSEVDPALLTSPFVSARLCAGRPAEVLLMEAIGAEMVVVGWRGSGGLTRFLMGSVASHLARYSPCTVIVVPEGSTVIAA